MSLFFNSLYLAGSGGDFLPDNDGKTLLISPAFLVSVDAARNDLAAVVSMQLLRVILVVIRGSVV